MSSGIIVLTVVAVGYLAARIAVHYLAHRFLIVSGAEYLVLGILLGPQVSGLMSAGVVDSFGPFMVLAIGWMGAGVGAQFHVPTLLRIRGPFYQTAFLQSILALMVVAAGMTGVFIWQFGITLEQAIGPAVVLSAVATASSLSGIALATRRVTTGRPLVRQLQVAGGMDAAVAIICFGLLLCVLHAPPPSGVRPPTATEWGVLTVAIGVVGGVLYHLFLGGERNPDRLFIALTAAITLASGVAAYARLSPLLPCMLIGAILVNTSKGREEIAQVLRRVHRPLYLVLLIFAGAAWRPAQDVWLLPIAAFVLLRTLAKVGAARLAGRLSGLGEVLGPDWGRALLGQGSLAISIALNYRIYDTSYLPNLVFTTALVSVLLTDLFSARFVQAVLRRHARRSQPVPAAASEEV